MTRHFEATFTWETDQETFLATTEEEAETLVEEIVGSAIIPALTIVRGSISHLRVRRVPFLLSQDDEE
jgi:hypothetical protein